MRTTKSCPKCRDILQVDARACQCGWTAREPEKAKNERPVVHCAHETCDVPARCRVKTPTGWADFCEPHYLRFHDDQARARCKERGLLKRPDESSTEYRKRMMAYMREHAKPKTFNDAVDDLAA